jgi:very-short-patch-repair endonuclease
MDINLEDNIHIKVCSRFYCHQLKLVIEIDGEYHQTVEQKLDQERTVNIEDQIRCNPFYQR